MTGIYDKNHFITTCKRSLGQGNIFTRVCHSVHGGLASQYTSQVTWLASRIGLSSGSSGQVRGGRETWNLCDRLWWSSFLWLVFTGLGGPWLPRPPGSATRPLGGSASRGVCIQGSLPLGGSAPGGSASGESSRRVERPPTRMPKAGGRHPTALFSCLKRMKFPMEFPHEIHIDLWYLIWHYVLQYFTAPQVGSIH